MESKELQTEVENILNKIFEEMGVNAELEFVPQEKENTYLKVKITSEDANLLIGYHGETLNSLQHIVNVMLYKKFEEPGGVLLDIEGYREERERKLLEVAENAVSKARFLDKSIALYPMNSYERKVVHEYVSSQNGVVSESEGDGAGRRVIITPVDGDVKSGENDGGEVSGDAGDEGIMVGESGTKGNGNDEDTGNYDADNNSTVDDSTDDNDEVGDSASDNDTTDMGEDFNYSEE